MRDTYLIQLLSTPGGLLTIIACSCCVFVLLPPTLTGLSGHNCSLQQIQNIYILVKWIFLALFSYIFCFCVKMLMLKCNVQFKNSDTKVNVVLNPTFSVCTPCRFVTVWCGYICFQI